MNPNLESLFEDILACDPDRRRANHFLKVDSYAELIGVAEGMPAEDLHWLRVACFLHDIGIKPSIEKHGSPGGQYQQVEGPPIAGDILATYNCPAQRVDRVKWLIAHHHEYADIRDLDHRILVEADFLVNCDEGGMAKPAIQSVHDKIFKTAAGTGMLETLFAL
ncbi:MAG: HD domain-containing protein [Planctomycetota bacterium]|jgi:hypothetical protein|nr:HD domain-containing protein [Planctomycetota bacterium]